MRQSREAPRKPPVVNQQRAALHGDITWRFPDRRFDDQEVPPGPAICRRCHAYLETDHWLFDEGRYQELQHRSGVHETLCPGCTRMERRLYEGEVTVAHDWSIFEKEMILNIIHNEEARARAHNPTARIALTEDRGDTLYILTTTVFLAERIGKELEKACHGTLRLSHLPRERFVRVTWTLPGR